MDLFFSIGEEDLLVRDFKKEAGMTMIEVLVATVIIMATLFGATVLITAQAKISQQQEQNLEIEQLHDTLVQWGRNQRTCTCHLSGTLGGGGRIVDLTATDGGSLDDIQALYSSCSAASPKILEVGRVPGTRTGLKVDRIRFTKVKPAGDDASALTRAVGQFEVSFKTSSDESIPRTIQLRQIVEILGPRDSARVDYCTAMWPGCGNICGWKTPGTLIPCMNLDPQIACPNGYFRMTLPTGPGTSAWTCTPP